MFELALIGLSLWMWGAGIAMVLIMFDQETARDYLRVAAWPVLFPWFFVWSFYADDSPSGPGDEWFP